MGLGFARFRFCGHEAMFLLMLSTMMLPLSSPLIAIVVIYGVQHVNLLMAASVVTALPCIVPFFAAQKYFVESVAMMGMKG